MNHAEWTKSFYTATHLLPEHLWRGIFTLSSEERVQCEEIRLRIGRPLIARSAQYSRQITDTDGKLIIVQKEDIDETLMRMTQSSLHTYLPQLIRGYFTTDHGHRVGVCGEVVSQNGQVTSLRNISSINIRIAKECRGIGEGLLSLRKPGESVLVISPPGGGKTTLLRDLARISSSDYRISIADERYELAACLNGKPRFDVGQCDVLSGGCKQESIEMLLRCMNPEIIVLDEITKEEDSHAVLDAWGCGCDFFASAHGASVEELYHRPTYRKLLQAGVFQYFILILEENMRRIYRAQKGGPHVKTDWDNYDHRRVYTHGDFHQPETL